MSIQRRSRYCGRIKFIPSDDFFIGAGESIDASPDFLRILSYLKVVVQRQAPQGMKESVSHGNRCNET